MDKQAIFDKLAAYLETEPEVAAYLAQPPESSQPFDPYQMVAEWIALKQEVKQQGKLLYSAYEALQQAQNPDSSEKALLKDLLPVMDAIDQACDYWRSQIDSIPESPQTFWQKLIPTSNEASLKAVFLSNQQGMEVIRRSLLDILQQRKVTPILALGQPFDASCMYAVARQTSDAPASTVIQEVVRGYRWQEQILREAQVIVAGNSEA
jgi:molecular chaperone GrpE